MKEFINKLINGSKIEINLKDYNINKWLEMGFLNDTNNIEKGKLAESYHYLYYEIMKDTYYDPISTFSFVLIYKIIKRDNSIEINKKFLKTFCDDLLNFVTSDYYVKTIEIYKSVNLIDAEAELISEFYNNYTYTNIN